MNKNVLYLLGIFFLNLTFYSADLAFAATTIETDGMHLNRTKGGSYTFGDITEKKKKTFWRKEKLVTRHHDENNKEITTSVTKGKNSVTIESGNVKILEKRLSNGTITRTTTSGHWGNRSKLTVVSHPKENEDGQVVYHTTEKYKPGFGSRLKNLFTNPEDPAQDAYDRRVKNETLFRNLQDVHNKAPNDENTYEDYTGFKLHGSGAPIMRGSKIVNGKEYNEQKAEEQAAALARRKDSKTNRSNSHPNQQTSNSPQCSNPKNGTKDFLRIKNEIARLQSVLESQYIEHETLEGTKESIDLVNSAKTPTKNSTWSEVKTVGKNGEIETKWQKAEKTPENKLKKTLNGLFRTPTKQPSDTPFAAIPVETLQKQLQAEILQREQSKAALTPKAAPSLVLVVAPVETPSREYWAAIQADKKQMLEAWAKVKDQDNLREDTYNKFSQQWKEKHPISVKVKTDSVPLNPSIQPEVTNSPQSGDLDPTALPPSK
jgi:hypothetical protein